MKELAKESNLKQYIATDCINILIRNGQVIKDQEPVSFKKCFTASFFPVTNILFF